MERTDVKKSVKHKPPVIRQTLTSIYRIAKANPLLFIEDAPKLNNAPVSFNLKNTKLPNSLKPISRNLTENNNKERAKTAQALQIKPKVKPAWNSNVTVTNNSTLNKKVMSIRPPLMVSKPKPKPKSTLTKPKVNFVTPATTAKPIPAKITKRRSLSADHYEHKKSSILSCNTTQSVTNLLDNFDCITPIQERRVKFQTPPGHQSRRSSIELTPTPFTRKHSTPYIIRTNYQLSDLHKRLTKWLRLHKKPVDSYPCLKSFGSDNNNRDHEEENKENIEGEHIVSGSYEDLRIITPVTPKKESEDLQDTVRGVLSDLHKLILEGFSVDQGEAWLNIIHQKYNFLEEESQYWECRAAIEQNRGNIACAVDYLRTAIVQGAEVKSVDESLEQLLQKFSLLNITTPGVGKFDESSMKNDRARIVNDARNVFKSSIIQFAIQERNLKKNALGDVEKKFVATPVRRSTRGTPSRYRVTPKVQVCSSLSELDNGVRCNMDFYSNKQLNVRFGNLKRKKD